MLNQLNQIKSKVCLCDKTLKELTKELDMDYNSFIRIINGYQKIPEGFFQKVELVLKTWKEK